MNNPYLLRNQLKENEEELSNYLRDMNIWQEQMKRKEHSLPTDNYVENKKTKTHNLSKCEVNKISSWDYAAWDKFDADKACEKLDIENKQEKSDYENSTNKYTNHVLQSKQSEALYEKNLGNTLVKNQKWSEAILRYTRAIEYYDKDPVFYANRALCYLKTNEFNLAIRDCTSSLEFNSSYVKAYQRRSAAYMSLRLFNEAIKDLNTILKFEPNNKQAKLDLEVVNNNIKKDSIKNKNDLKLKNVNTINNKKQSSNMLCNNIETPVKNIIPQWPPRVDCKQIIISKLKPPHLRSKKPFCIPKIKDVQKYQEETDDKYLLQTTLKEVCDKDQLKKKQLNIFEANNLVKTGKKHSLNVPSIPQTYVQLKQDWMYLQNDSKLLFKYLRQIPGKRLPLIVRNSMDYDLFVDILRILMIEFVQNGYEITDYLVGISELPRLQMLVMFCSESEVICIKELLNHVSKYVSDKLFKNLKNAFGI